MRSCAQPAARESSQQSPAPAHSTIAHSLAVFVTLKLPVTHTPLLDPGMGAQKSPSEQSFAT